MLLLLTDTRQVTVMQEYFNTSSETIEARYIFPLPPQAAVCGFEAFVNGVRMTYMCM
jgi:poly [ADP-ribose] polymerase 2/3/4